jgi:hypothetical protein
MQLGANVYRLTGSSIGCGSRSMVERGLAERTSCSRASSRKGQRRPGGEAQDRTITA